MVCEYESLELYAVEVLKMDGLNVFGGRRHDSGGAPSVTKTLLSDPEGPVIDLEKYDCNRIVGLFLLMG